MVLLARQITNTHHFGLAFAFCSLAMLGGLGIEPANAAAPTAGLVGYWSFDNGTGASATDSSGNGNSGALAGGATWTTGKVGTGALQFDGTTGYVSIANIPFGGTKPISVCAWIKPSGFSGARTIFSEASEIVLQMNGTSVVWILNSFATNDRVTVAGNMTAGNWYHVCGVYNTGGAMQVYIDGTLRGSVTPTGSYAGVSNKIEIGRMGGYNSGYFGGSIDEVRLYNVALSAADVVATFGGGASAPPPTGSVPVINSFSASPASIASGQTSTLSWSITGATAINIDREPGVASPVTTGSVSIAPGATSTYVLTATNAYGSKSASATVTVTAAAPDTTAPSTPAQLSAQAVSSSQINLSWSASTDNLGVAGYRIYRDGLQAGTAASTTFSDAGLAASTPHTYKVAAYDAAGNLSGQCTGVSATTLPASGGGLPVSVTPNAASVGRYGIFELTFTHTTKYTNPWEDVLISASFQAPSGARYTVGGFYYDTNTWKLRFAPRETGSYLWNATFTTPTGSYAASGSLASTASANTGFLRISPANPYQMITEGDGKYFYPIGFNDLVGDWFNTATGRGDGQSGFYGDGKLDWALGADPAPLTVDSDTYFAAYRQGKNNFFRWNGQGTLPIWATGQVNVNGTGKNVYNVGNGKMADEMAMKLQQYGFKYQMAFMADPTLLLPNFDMTNTAKYNSLLSLHRYVINRWGAYVDIWELMNEKSGVPAAYYSAITAFIRANDPYQHPVTTSYVPSSPQPGIEITSPHNYISTANTTVDSSMKSYLTPLKAKYLNSPMILGEVGNQSPICNYDPVRYRLFLWATLMNEASPIFWNTSYSKTNCTGLTNMYIGTEERAFSAVFANFVATFDPLARPVPASSASTVRVHAMGSSQSVAAYVVHAGSLTTSLSGATVTVTVPKAGLTGAWINPGTGAVLSTFSPAAGSQTLTVPAFSADIVLRIQ
jgi:hypothetical protein